MQQASESPVLVGVEALTKIYRTREGSEVEALSPVTLDVRRGELISLIGPSGCGKSTLLRLLAGLEKPSGGQIRWRDGAPSRGTDIGFVFQEPVLLPWLSIQDNVRFPLDVFSIAKSEANERAASMLALVGLKDFGKALPKELSGGMRQRASIARALVYHPRLVLMDEPFGALDLLTRDRMNDELLRIKTETAATIIFVTHSIDEAVYLSDRVAVMSPRPGRISALHTLDFGGARNESVKDSPDFHRWLSVLRRELK
ncbi:ABC transporter ATP-binding protein [Mesorhizobium sp. L-8-3]|uniref:ABC transporter ATP-binding protein n=1 Tax=Mesorhizobium sp. L-8-3 TaxID=2744522 RepID=UPI00192930E1|nr:ABC transporter ATP-binding protein [Mesorhizobium sp. L-8-3]BCH21022.1 nitrate/sulfonate/bicarbonate ABC transporter ATP-binding protein [Mesorhizobium sp. L-8-3]